MVLARVMVLFIYLLSGTILKVGPTDRMLELGAAKKLGLLSSFIVQDS